MLFKLPLAAATYTRVRIMGHQVKGSGKELSIVHMSIFLCIDDDDNDDDKIDECIVVKF